MDAEGLGVSIPHRTGNSDSSAQDANRSTDVPESPSSASRDQSSLEAFLSRRRSQMSDHEHPADHPLRERPTGGIEDAPAPVPEESNPEVDQPAPSEPEPTTTEANTMGEEKMCRICFGGDDPALGRLFSPCQCRGSLRFVHVACLDRWRRTSPNRQAWMECPQCKFRYRFRRARIAGLAENPIALFTLTAFSFFALIWLAGYLALWFLTAASSDPFPTIHVVGPYGFGYTDPVLFKHVVGSVSESLGVDIDEVIFDEDDEEVSFVTEPGSSGWLSWFRWEDEEKETRLGLQEEDDLVRLEDNEDSDSYHYVRKRPTTRQRRQSHRVKHRRRGKLQHYVTHFLLGLILVSAASVIQFVFSLSFLGRPNLLTGRRGRGGTSFEGIVVIAIIAIGAVKAFYACWRGTRRAVRFFLSRLEDAVLDVS